MNLEMIKSNYGYCSEKFKLKTFNAVIEAKSVILRAGVALKPAAIAAAIGPLYLTSGLMDLAFKSTLIAAPFFSFVLMADAYYFSKGNPTFINECNESCPYMFVKEKLKPNVNGTYECGPIPANKLTEYVRTQFLMGAALLIVATPIAALTFRKIERFCNKMLDKRNA